MKDIIHTTAVGRQKNKNITIDVPAKTDLMGSQSVMQNVYSTLAANITAARKRLITKNGPPDVKKQVCTII